MDSTSKVVVTADEADAFQRALLTELRNVKVGDPTDRESIMGPVISEKDMEGCFARRNPAGTI